MGPLGACVGLIDFTRTPVRSGVLCCFVLCFFMGDITRTPVRSGDLVPFFEPSEGPLEALWGHSWGTVSAYPFNMLKKP